MNPDLRQRDPREIDSDYKGWIAQLPCVACLIMKGRFHRLVQVAHCRISDAEAGWRSVGMQEKPDDRKCTPLCHLHHQNGPRETCQHKMNERVFWDELLAINVFQLVADLNHAYDADADGEAVIIRHAARATMALRERAAHA